MKKILLSFLGVFLFATPVLASTVKMTQSTTNITPGKEFNVDITIDPDTIDFAEKLNINFPVAYFEVVSFELAPIWVNFSQSGYNTTDNTNGLLTRSAGYPGGLNFVAKYGTIVFKAKKVGTANITVNNNSRSYQGSSNSSLTGPGLAVTVKTTGATPTPTPTNTHRPSSSHTPTHTPTATPEPTETVDIPTVTPSATPNAAANSILDSKYGLPLITGILIVLVLVGYFGYLAYKSNSRRSSRGPTRGPSSPDGSGSPGSFQ